MKFIFSALSIQRIILNNCFMRKLASFVSSITLTLVFFTPSVQGASLPAPSAGKPCDKPQQLIHVGKTSLICTSVSTKSAVWKVSMAKSFLPSQAPTTFQDLDSHVYGIIYGAWLKATQQLKAATPTLGNVKLLVGPNTKEDDPSSATSLKLVSQLYSQLSQVKNLYVIKYSKADLNWAQQQWEALKPLNYDPSYFQHQCLPPAGCVGGVASITPSGDGVIALGQGGLYDGQPTVQGLNRASSGQVAAHEYTHTIQMLNSLTSSSTTTYGNLPRWLLEGNAEWSATVARFNSSYEDYLTFRTMDITGQYSHPYGYSSQWLTTYLNPNPLSVSGQDNWSYWNSYPQWDLYAIGYLANEALVDVKGPDSILNLYKDVGSGQTFQQAFQQEFGMAWSDACPILAKAISDEIQKIVKS